MAYMNYFFFEVALTLYVIDFNEYEYSLLKIHRIHTLQLQQLYLLSLCKHSGSSQYYFSLLPLFNFFLFVLNRVNESTNYSHSRPYPPLEETFTHQIKSC